MHDRVKLEVVATYIRERLLWILFKLDEKDLYNVQKHNSSIALRLTIGTLRYKDADAAKDGRK